MHKHRARLISIGLLAALSIAFLVQVLASSDSSVGGGFGYEADSEHGFYVLRPELAPGDHFRLGWEWVFGGFSPVFLGGDFYVIEGDADFPFQPADHRVLFHGQDAEAACCSHDSWLEMSREPDQEPLSFVWVLNYAEGWEPLGAQTTGLVPLLGGTDTSAQDRELGYIRAFIGAGGQNSMHGPFQNLDITQGGTLDRQQGFLWVEGLLATGAVAFWALSLSRPQPLAKGAGVAGLIALVERGRDHLRAQLRLHLLVGPLLFITAIFATEAIDNGGFGFYDPTGVYETWVIVGLLGLWLTALVIWIVGLVRVSRSLRHFNKTQEPDLGA